MGRPTTAIMHFGKRSCLNATCRLLYIFLKVVYMSFIFYWGLYLVPQKPFLVTEQFIVYRAEGYDSYIELDNAGF